MKKFLIALLTCTALIGYAQPVTLDDNYSILSASNLSWEQLESLLASKDSSIVLELRKSTEIPLSFLMKSSLCSISFKPNLSIKIEKDCYLRLIKKRCYISEDLVSWEKINKWIGKKGSGHISKLPVQSGFVLEMSYPPEELANSTQ